MLDESQAVSLAQALWVDHRDNRERSKTWQNWALGKQELPVIPDTATAEYRALQEKAITPWLGLLVQSLAQALIAEGYRAEGTDDNNLLWSVWQANRMDSGQVVVHDAALTTGVSYVAVLPTGTPRARSKPLIEGSLPAPEWRPYSSAEMTGFYESPHDEWPVYALAAERAPTFRRQSGAREVWRLVLFDDQAVYLLDYPDGGTPTLIDEPRLHGHGIPPIVRFVNRRDIHGRALGEVEPYTAIASRIDQDVFDRLIVQRFASWRVRTATGLAQPADEDDATRQALLLLVSDLLVSDSPDTKFGSLPETPMDGHLRAPIEDVRMLAAVSQTPPTVLTGDLSNISADALAAVESAYNRKCEQRKVSFGESWEQVFALSAPMVGQDPDPSAQIRWRDMESRSMAQTADAFGKLATTLEIPVEVLWDKLGFLTEQDRERAKELRNASDAHGNLLDELAAGQTTAMDPAELKAKADAFGVLVRSGVDPVEAAARAGLPGMTMTGAVPVSLRQPKDEVPTLEPK